MRSSCALARSLAQRLNLCRHCFARPLCHSSSDANRGSTASIDLDEFAWWFKQTLELIRSIFDCFGRVSRMIKEGRLANWAKHQGAAAERLAKAVSASAERQRRYRRRKAENARQGEFGLRRVFAAARGDRRARPQAPYQASHRPQSQRRRQVIRRDAEIERAAPRSGCAYQGLSGKGEAACRRTTGTPEVADFARSAA